MDLEEIGINARNWIDLAQDIGRNIYKEWMTTDYSKNLNYKPEGRRNIGRPLMRWEDDFREERTD